MTISLFIIVELDQVLWRQRIPLIPRGSPSSHDWESWSDVEVNLCVSLDRITGRNISQRIEVVKIMSIIRKVALKRIDRVSNSLRMVVDSSEFSCQLGDLVHEVILLIDNVVS